MAAVTLGTETDGSILCRCRSTQLSASSPSSGSPAAPASSPSPRRRTPLDRTMCRTVSAAVHVLDFIIGYDEHDAAATRAASKYIPHGIAFNNQHPTEFLLWAFLCPAASATPCHPDDLRALRGFAGELGGGGALLRTAWSGASCCDWEGVGCDGASGRVTALRLPGRGLSGQIPGVSLGGHAQPRRDAVQRPDDRERVPEQRLCSVHAQPERAVSRDGRCGDGHLTCHRCHDADHMATVCTRCGSKDYTRSRAVARMVGSVLFACRNRQHGCAASLPRHAVEEHERSCRYEPCFFPACQRPFFPGVDDSAQERHLAGRHDWLLHPPPDPSTPSLDREGRGSSSRRIAPAARAGALTLSRFR
ncbi:hypothetical protein ZWY2020_046115 [Hordeum vulgare]|nr:hypothetical protein ZWY2020_046115 [Hordeum vulgare]